MKYVLGGGISGLLWAYYHQDYVIVTDQLGRAVTGADPIVWLNCTSLTNRLLVDLGLWPVEMIEKPIGYKNGNVITGVHDTSSQTFDRILLKKIVPWEAIDAAQVVGIKLSVNTPSRTFTKDSGVLRYLDVSVGEVCRRLYRKAQERSQIEEGRRIVQINENGMATESCGWGYEHLVSTIPAPAFRRLWKGSVGLPRLHYCPVTFVVSQVAPTWWDDGFVVVYDADLDSPISRVGRFGNTWRYEFTGRPDDDTLNDYLPVTNGRFVNPYGRIVQDVKLELPDPKITFLGRSAEWDFRGLIDRTLERVHGFR